MKKLYLTNAHSRLSFEDPGSAGAGPRHPRAPQLEETPETPPSSRAEGLLFLHVPYPIHGTTIFNEFLNSDVFITLTAFYLIKINM